MGLTEAEAAARLQARGDAPRQRSSRSYASIIRANTLTIPNGILLVFGVLTITFGSWKDALFLGILFANIGIGSFQEIRSKRALDRLAALVAPQAVVVRDGADTSVPVDQVVAGDLVRLAAGDQVVADGTLVTADGIALDEANLTGESEPVVRHEGEPVWSGSFAVEGAATFEATAVGADSRASRLTATARAFRHPRSPLERVNDRLLLLLFGCSIPLAAGLVATAFTRTDTAAERIQLMTAGIVNLVPEGLILLISLTAAVSAFKVAKRGVLAQQLNAVESLASVDVIFTDKTGTLTEATLRVVGLLPAGGVDEAALAQTVATYAASAPTRNLTLQAIADAGLAEVEPREVAGQVPFSSRRRWSALDLGDERLVLGAPERFGAVDAALVEQAAREAGTGRRVLAFGRSEAPLPPSDPEPSFPADVQALGLVVLAERLRPNASETVAFFAEQDVQLKVLSGDAPATVGAIARDAGVLGSAPALDGEALPSEPEELREAVLSAPAVGRISPDGKRAVVDALTAAGRYVAMIGDGVNDVPALKEARLAIAQGSGTQMARTVADLVLVRNDFGVVPGMVAEGRQILRNIQRVAQLFVTKTVFVAVAGLAIALPTATFPAPPAPVHDRVDGHDRHPRLRAGAGAQRRAVEGGGIPALGGALRASRRSGDRHRNHGRLPPRALRLRPGREPLAHGRDGGRRRLRPGGRPAARGTGPAPPQHRGRRALPCDGPAVRARAGRSFPARLLRAGQAHRRRSRCLGGRIGSRNRRDARRAAPVPRLNGPR